ncbi:2-oxo acid dehydrogenase subunit E2 [Candidatus Ichthyocystis hellenicum]|uniref:2-oxo acid dehydrogenase subunit E2 n=1 Tax=Candidatus Ichthyocystis hellenicum TaxID=1561003 RepID=UPI000AA20800|nr:2-oxo acid dehydrogenase subunit E2 [Candidatus Ichthyocystis hellenicum]
MSQIKDIIIPPVGDQKDLPVIEVLVTTGDHISENQSILVLESDKATIEVPSPISGVVESISVSVGDKISAGNCIGKVRTAPDTEKKPGNVPNKNHSSTNTNSNKHTYSTGKATSSKPNTGTDNLPYASPAVRKFARELNVDLTTVTGTGSRGRIVKEDVKNHLGVTSDKAKVPLSSESYQEDIRIDRSRIQQLSAEFLSKNWNTIPHVTNCEDADITELEEFRKHINQKHKDENIKLTLVSFLVKICSAGLKEFPKMNSSLDGNELVLKKDINIGFVVDTPHGLIVPVIRNADRYGIIEISKEIVRLSEKARSGKIAPSDMEDGTFSISSLGGIGGTYFTPIIRGPEVAMLGVCRSSIKAVWDGHAFQPRLILPLSLSWDHRVVDGVLAARFNRFIKEILEDLRMLNI